MKSSNWKLYISLGKLFSITLGILLSIGVGKPSSISISAVKYDELGAALMKAFIHTIPDLDYLPDTLIFYNTGVKLAVQNSDVLDDLEKLQESGVELLVCGTCAKFFNIKEEISVGIISNMYDIAGAMAKAGRIVKP